MRGWVGKRAEYIEYASDADFFSRADGVFHGLMQRRRKKKTYTDGVKAFFHGAGIGGYVDAQRFQHVGAAALARHGAVTVLGDDGASACGHECRGRGNIETYRRYRRRYRRCQQRLTGRWGSRGLLFHA